MVLGSPFMAGSCVAVAPLYPQSGDRERKATAARIRAGGMWASRAQKPTRADRIGMDRTGDGSGRVRDPVASAVHVLDDLGGHAHATAAAGAATRTHGQFGHGPAACGRGLADFALGDSIAEADVHGSEWKLGTVLIEPRVRMIVNSDLAGAPRGPALVISPTRPPGRPPARHTVQVGAGGSAAATIDAVRSWARGSPERPPPGARTARDDAVRGCRPCA